MGLLRPGSNELSYNEGRMLLAYIERNPLTPVRAPPTGLAKWAPDLQDVWNVEFERERERDREKLHNIKGRGAERQRR